MRDEIDAREGHFGFPPRYAAASLKLFGLRSRSAPDVKFSAALCGGLIEARWRRLSGRRSLSFPPRYAAASLKPEYRLVSRISPGMFSAALCGGLIEAA